MNYFTQSIQALAVAAALALPALAFAAEPAMEKGGMWTDHHGMTLYTFDKDKGTESACYDQCAKNWPPLKVEGAAKPTGDWTVIERKDDAKQQWAYKGKPLYTYIEDKKAGDKSGDGKGGVWHVAKSN
ncbi:COG4315 family predicted lipoprotein [Pseudomonas fluorescens]|uniref:COG4315 family predicted lipoprotein n=1 Tax=Pseudomonas fluorescens TaxID=294 RepID=UPI0027895474|nr:hypothetical protein [Pseudomonas fluorescens]MDP9783300.1 putative lipoprotein with Yx(FWY)xxD motif [Pseudomonas fluorescens]